MRKLTSGLASLLVAGALALPAFSQDPVTTTPADPVPRADRTTTIDDRTDDDVGFNPGWLGLLGLIGLAGLMPRGRREHHHAHHVGATTTPVTR